MIKKISAFSLILALIWTNVYAVKDSKSLYTKFEMYTANVYYCDSANNLLILKDVVPQDEQYSDLIIPQRYNAVSFSERGLFGFEADIITPLQINEKYLDESVIILAAENEYGVKIVITKFVR